MITSFKKIYLNLKTFIFNTAKLFILLFLIVFVYKLWKKDNAEIDTENNIFNALDSINNKIKEIKKQKEDLNTKINDIESNQDNVNQSVSKYFD